MLIYIGTLALFIVLTVALLWYVAWVARKRAAADEARPATDEASVQRKVGGLRAAFNNSIALIELNLASRWRRYRIPWILLVGEPGSGKSTLIENAGLDRAFRSSSGVAVRHAGIGWHYFNRGIVLDVGGELLDAGDGGDRGDSVWNALLRLVEKYRPQRAIDGVVVTISAAELGAGNADFERIAKQADLVHRRLWQAQRRFGICFPVYVVITQCDRIGGFGSFTRALPERMRNGLFGWSNPYDFEAGYQSEWAAAAVEGISQNVFELQAELLATEKPVADTDSFVLFPAALAAIEGPLQAYLDQLFRPSAYHESFFFRGIYLTGDSFAPEAVTGNAAMAARGESPSLSTDAIAAAAMAGRMPGTQRKPLFVRDVFERKVFAEFGMARPSREARLSRNRTVRALRWTTMTVALVWLATLGLAAFQLNSKVDAYDYALSLMVSARQERDAAHARHEHLPPEWYLRNTTALIDRMAPLGGVRLWWFSIPGSWPAFSPIHAEIQHTLYGGFQDIVFNVVRKGLNVKVSEISGVPIGPVTTELEATGEQCNPMPSSKDEATFVPGLAIEDLPEFKQLLDHVRKVTSLEANLATFDRLREGHGQIPELRTLLKYTWGIDLPASLNEGGYHTEAMRQGYKFAETPPGDVFRATIGCTFNQEVDATFKRFFSQNQVRTLGLGIVAGIARLHESDDNTALDVDAYSKLLSDLQTLDGLLKNPRSAWLQSGERGLGAGFDDLLQQVSATTSLGSRTRDAMRMSAQASIENLRRELAGLTTEAVGPLLSQQPGTGHMDLTTDMVGFETALAGLVKQRFMTGPVEDRALDTSVGARASVSWDLKRLDDAIAMADDQRRYIKDNLAKFPAVLQPDVLSMANLQLARRMTDMISLAETIGPQSLSRKRFDVPAPDSGTQQDFDQSGARLVKLLGIMKEIGADATYDDLASLMKQDAVRGLQAIDRTLTASETYAVRDGGFSWWQGEKDPAIMAFRVPDTQGLADFLSEQYAQIEWLSKLSQPLLGVIDSARIRLDPDAGRMVARWRGINREVERFKSKNPRSSVAELEAFIRTTMVEVDGQNCMDKLSTRTGAARDADFFLSRAIMLRQQLYARCADLASARTNAAYAIVEQNFRRLLAGRFPFSQQTEQPSSGPGFVQQADPDDIVHFFRLFDQNAKAAVPVADSRSADAASRQEVRTFLEKMTLVRAFLAPLIPPEDNPAADGYAVGIEFRVNQRAEVDGNKIVDWALSIGDQRVDFRDTKRLLRWRVGLPVTLTLRWAKDAPTAPINDGTQAHLGVDAKTVTFRFTDPWALITMMKLHAATSVDAGSRADFRPNTLKFEFPTQPVSEGGQFRSSAPLGHARIFLRLFVTPDGKKDMLTLPVFPVSAPQLAAEGNPSPRVTGRRSN